MGDPLPSLADSLAAEPALFGKSLASEGEYGSAMFSCSARCQEGSSTPRMHTAISFKRMAHACCCSFHMVLPCTNVHPMLTLFVHTRTRVGARRGMARWTTSTATLGIMPCQSDEWARVGPHGPRRATRAWCAPRLASPRPACVSVYRARIVAVIDEVKHTYRSSIANHSSSIYLTHPPLPSPTPDTPPQRPVTTETWPSRARYRYRL